MLPRNLIRAALLGPLLPLLAVASCATPPRFALENGRDVVRAADQATAAEVGALLAAGRDTVQGWLPGLRDVGVDVWVQDELYLDPVLRPYMPHLEGSAFTVDMTWFRRPRIHVTTGGYQGTLVHELTHALLGPSWSTLPPALEEGLCELAGLPFSGCEVAAGRLGAAAGRNSVSFAVGRAGPSGSYVPVVSVFFALALPESNAIGVAGELESELTVREILSREDYGELSRHEAAHFYGVGYFLTDRIVALHGVEGLHELCVRAGEAGERQVPVDWVLSAAGIEDEAGFDRHLDEALKTDTLCWAIGSEAFHEAVQTLRTSECADCSVEEFVETVQPALSIAEEAPIPLADLPAFHRWAAKHWDSPIHPHVLGPATR